MRTSRMAVIFALLVLPLLASAEVVTGTVTNGTTGKVAAGVSVTLVDPMGGMAELGTAKSDAQGRFRIEAPAAQGPRLVRAEKGGVNYFKMIPPKSTSVDLKVFEAAESVDGITGAADVVKVQTQGSTMQAVELFALKNESNPPRALASKATFEFVLPEGSQLDGVDAQGPNGQPISVTPEAGREKNHYTLSYALKPGETRFQVSYHLPYSGEATFAPHLVRSFDHYVLVVPATMKFTAKDASQFRTMSNEPGTTVEVSLHAKSGDDLSYSLSGTGEFPVEQAQGESAPAPAAGAENRPGGGLGKPEDAPDGLAKYRWYILFLLAAVLTGGGIWTRERTLMETAVIRGTMPVVAKGESGVPVAKAAETVAPQAPANDALLAALKEELFQLEIERQQGKFAPGEYEKARAAVEQTLQRALNRKSS